MFKNWKIIPGSIAHTASEFMNNDCNLVSLFPFGVGVGVGVELM